MEVSLWNCCKDKKNDVVNKPNNNNYRINNDQATTKKSFEYKTKILESTANDNNTIKTEVVAQLKNLIKFWKPLDLPLLNSKIELNSSWSKYCITLQILRTPPIAANPNSVPPIPDAQVSSMCSATLQIISVKLFILIVTLSINDTIKFLENLKKRFKRTMSWKKYRSEVTIQAKKMLT